MSSVTYEEMLREAMVDLSEMMEQDSKIAGKKLGLDKMADYQFFLSHWSAMYIRYIQIARKLEKCHDQVLHPQKRADVRVALDSCIGRMLEMKHQLTEYCGEFVNVDEALVDMKLTPDALEIPIPTYFVEEREAELAAREKMIESFRASFKTDTEVLPSAISRSSGPPEPPLTLEKAVEILQCNERGRQGRQHVKLQKEIYEQEQHEAGDFEYGGKMPHDEAARNIQRVVRGYLCRKKTKVLRKNELEFLGMEMSESTSSNAQRDRLVKTLHDRKMKQLGNIAELSQEAKDMRVRIKTQEGGQDMEKMLDEILEHLCNVRLLKGDQLPEFNLEEGGSLALLGRVQTAASEEQKEEEKPKPGAKPAAKPAKPGAKGRGKEEEEDSAKVLAPSMFWDRFKETRDRYVGTWNPLFQKSYFDDKEFDQKFDTEILRNEILEGPGGTMLELRKCVDQLVFVELQNLREKMERERGGKRKKPKKPKKPKKAKAVKDPTEGKKLEVHAQHLVWLSALLPTPKVRLSDYLGTYNLMGAVMEEHEKLHADQQDEVKAKWQTLINNWNEYVEKSLNMTRDQFEVLFKNFCEQSSWSFEPSMQQVRQAVAEYCILPLGSQVIHDLAGPHPTAVLLYGPESSGKTMLTHAIAAETGAALFNLSPEVINKEGTNLQKLVQTVFRVARSLAPSVIYIDEVEKVFLSAKGKKKKKKGEGAGKSAKIKKDLVNALKELDATDRVVVVGNSRAPWDGDFKEMTNFFKCMIYCVHPDYASRLLLWREVAEKLGAKLTDNEYEVLTYMSNKYTSGVIVQVIKNTLNDRRIKRIAQRPVKASEFLPHLARAVPIFREDYEALKEFVGRLPMGMRRVKPEDFKKDDDGEAKPKPGGKKPGGKK